MDRDNTPRRRALEPCQAASEAREEISILQQILLLHDGQLENFHPGPPPSAVKRFLNRAALGQLQGLLVELLCTLRNVKSDYCSLNRQ